MIDPFYVAEMNNEDWDGSWEDMCNEKTIIQEIRQPGWRLSYNPGSGNCTPKRDGRADGLNLKNC